MFKFIYFILCYIACHLLTAEITHNDLKYPSVIIAILARNKAHTLPYFLSMLQNISYPKDRICLWIRSDHNSDNTIEILKLWLNDVQNDYHCIDAYFDEESKNYKEETGPAHWPPERFNQVIKLREDALRYARQKWAHYIMLLDCDVFFVNKDILQNLIFKNLSVVAPLLKSDGLYSNFWAGMTENYYYERTDEYEPILNRENLGCHQVPMIHSCVLIDLNRILSDQLTFNPALVSAYNGPRDDIITFALSANRSNIPLHVCNDEIFGFVTIPLEQDDNLELDLQQFVNIKLEIMMEHHPLHLNDLLKHFYTPPKKDTLGFDAIFMINLQRRPERRFRMLNMFDELGIEAEIRDAVDGQYLNDTILTNIEFLPGYSDPYHKRPMKLGEIGCFLSHYEIWNEMLSRDLDFILVLEDDIRFQPFFRAKITRFVQELLHGDFDWDFVYLGRKPMSSDDEPWLQGNSYLVEAGYSYWTLGYVLRASGARKLIEAHPLKRLLPVDEYLPLMFDKHPREDWKKYYKNRNLKALSVAPLLLYPMRYTGEEGYVSDTEDSNIIPHKQHTEF